MSDLRISGASTSPHSESDIRVNYGDPSKIIAASNDINNQIQAQFYSTDGGATWGQTSLSLVGGDGLHSDPAVDWTSDGTAWAITIGVSGGVTNTLRGYKSTDSGATWASDATVSGTQTAVDREIMWVDHSPTSPFKDQIYCTWHNGVPVFVNRRTAGASGTWQTPLQVSGAETTGVGIGGDVKTNSFGDVFVFWQDADGSRNIEVVKSVNGGATFGAPVRIAQTFASTRKLSIPADSGRQARVYTSGGAFRTASKNLVYVVWPDLSGAAGCTTGGGPGTSTGSTCKTRIWFSRSTDGGATWSSPAMINNQASLNDQFHSKLSVDESNGNLMVIYDDTVNDAGRKKTDIWMQVSTDDGVTWSGASQVTSAQTDETSAGADGGNQYGDYNGLTGFYGTFFPSWTDRRGGGAEEIWTARLSIVPKDLFFILDRSSFGQDEVQAMVAAGSPTFDAAFYVVVDGFAAADLGIVAADLTGAPTHNPALTVSPALSQMMVGAPTALLAEGGTLLGVPQRFTWVYPITFSGTADFTAQIVPVTLSASMSTVSGAGVIDLLQQPDPYELDGPTSWLSTDLRVFQIRAGDAKFNATMGSTASAAPSFIQTVVDHLNTGNTAGQTFENDLSLDENASSLALFETDASNTPVFNFAVAKVRYRGLAQDAQSVRVFFRLCPAMTVSTAYDQSTTYRRSSDGVQYGHTIALLGTQNNNILTIPCFAEPRVATTTASMTAQTDPTNVHTILHDASGAEVVRYFGAWLDINQPSQTWFPLNPSSDGPFGGTLKSVLELVRNQHQCLIAEIAFDPDPVATGATPGTSDKLAQRNLTLVASANPGDVTSRRIPNTFELKATPPQTAQPKIGKPGNDELMIDWGNTPTGSVARIYLPTVSADDILELAAKRYSAAHLTRIDAHTVECPVRKITYVPIPPGPSLNHTGLLTIDLPSGVRRGQHFRAVVRQITHTHSTVAVPPGEAAPRRAAAAPRAAKRHDFDWRTVLGAFQVSIPVSVKEAMLGDEERLLSVLRFILRSVPAQDRWHPTFARYVAEIAQRVKGLGGDPGRILPSPTGQGERPHPPHGGPETRVGYTGKINGLMYDRFGDFEGFLLDTEDGERTFRSREHEVEELARRAWTERIRLTVYTERHDPHRPETIVLRDAPRPPRF